MCNMTHGWEGRDSFMRVIWRIHMSNMKINLSNVWHGSLTTGTWPIYAFVMTHSHEQHNNDFIRCVTWLIDERDVTHLWEGRDSFMRVIWRIHMSNMMMISLDVWHDSLTTGTWPIYAFVMTHSHTQHHDDFIRCVTWLIDERDVTHLWEGRDLFMRVIWRIHMSSIKDKFIKCVKWLIDDRDVTHLCVCYDALTWATWWWLLQINDMTLWREGRDSSMCSIQHIHMSNILMTSSNA